MAGEDDLPDDLELGDADDPNLDDEDDGDAAEPETDAAVDDADPAEDDEPTRRQPRENDAIRTLRRRAQEAERERDDERRRRESVELNSRTAPVDRAREEREEQERLALMDPEQRFQHLRAKDQQQFRQEMYGAELRSADRADRSDFRMLCRDEPALAKVSDEVEKVLAFERSQGRNPTREVVANFIIGRDARKRAASAGTRQRRVASNERSRQTAQPGRSRSDVPARGGRTDDKTARAKRLENMDI